MISSFRTSISLMVFLRVALACFIASGSFCAAQQSAPNHPAQAASAASSIVPALFISDIHFDPFHDPGKVKELAAAPVSEWRSILSSSPSPNQQQAFSALQHGCHAKGIDTPFALFESSLKAMHTQQPEAKFIVVSGDLMAHAFPCRYDAIFPGAPHADYEAFSVKTVRFVAEQLRGRFPGIPVYLALGNNDSGCGDYQLDAGNDWLTQVGKVMTEGLPAAEREQAAKEFNAGGYYSVSMAEPMKNTRLVVVNDVFFSPRYKTCSGEHDSAAGDAQLDWLARQLHDARQAGQRVWVLGHIPPGIDLHATALRFADVCGGDKPVKFLSSDKMADLLVENADTVRLAIFGHTHMDELHLLKPEGGEAKAADGQEVVLKQIPSISPVDGNNPSFTAARVDPKAATIEDYTVVAASNQTGAGTVWSKEYEYGRTYHEPEFSAAAMTELTARFQSDQAANLPISQSYLRNYFVGDRAAELSLFWPQYACTFDHYTAKGYEACACPAGK